MTSGLLDPEFLIGASLADGRFKIVARIGAGSMAVVYRAFDHRLETDVVVKVPKKQKLEDPGLRERFKRESRLLVQLQHPHIVRVLDIGLHSNVPYVVMQYLSGGCLLDRMIGPNGQPCAVKIPSICDWVQPVAKALDYAHQQKIVHRDVKPANIMFDHAGNAFLGDFGLTKIMHGDPSEDAADETAAGFVVGTPNFVAPEIVLGKDYDGRADQYSLAITIYHALIGQPPMLGKSPSATMVNQTRRILPLLSDIRKAVPPPAAEAIARALSKNPEARFSSCSEFADAVIFPLNVKAPREDVSANDSSMAVRRDRNDSTNKGWVSGSETSVPGHSRAADSTSDASRFQKGRSIRQSVASRPGVFSCPVCHRQLKLRGEHAGRIGRCVRCNTRLVIAADLQLIKVLNDSSSSSERNELSSSTDDLVVGDSLFGLRLSRRNLLAISGITLLMAILGVSLFIHQLTRVDLEREEQRIRQQYQNRED